MISIFNKHPKEVCMTYFQHFKLSMSLSKLFLEGTIKAIIHAFFPFWYLSSSTRINKNISFILKNSGCRKNL